MNFGIVDGLAVVVIGFGMVFAILCIISFVLSIFSFVYKIKEKKKNAATVFESKPIQKEEPVEDANKTDDLELVAVITSAIAASMNTTSDKIVIRSIRKTSNWNKAAIAENQKSFY